MIDADQVPETLASRAARMFAAFQGGDETTMSDLVGLLTPILWHTVRAQRLDHQSAEDVIQSTWLALVRNSASIAQPQAVLQWLMVTARREAWRVTKREDRVDPTDFDADDLETTPDDAPEDLVLRQDNDIRLWQHIAQLPERCRALLRVIAFADRPDYAAVAESLGMPIGSIGPTRGRCLAKLRLQLGSDPGWES
ncbi:MAG TPA: sigma-70 family RNA polymerase sigma factor [Jatrophihabitantaceae bacterium]|jgi:RNA polymerase sigma factor (sigma-70 family)